MREKQQFIAIVFLCSLAESQNEYFKQTWRGQPDSDAHLLHATNVKLKVKVSTHR